METCFSPNRPLGENAIATKLKVATKKLGLGDVGGHALLCGTTLHNAEGVSVEEALATIRHGLLPQLAHTWCMVKPRRRIN